MGRRTCGQYQAKVRKEKYAKQFATTEANRRRKRLRHFKQHPNNIKGVEKLRESLGLPT